MRHRLSKWHSAAAVCGALFLVLMLTIAFAPMEFRAFDAFAARAIASLQGWTGIEIFLTFTTLGSTTGIIAVAVGIAYFIRKRPAEVVRLVIALAGSSLCVALIKHIVARARPHALAWFDPLHTYSFPSGHSTSAMALYGFVAVLAFSRARTDLNRVLAIALPSFLILLIGLSRIVLSAHFISDVIGGFLLGAFWLAFAHVIPIKLSKHKAA